MSNSINLKNQSLILSARQLRANNKRLKEEKSQEKIPKFFPGDNPAGTEPNCKESSAAYCSSGYTSWEPPLFDREIDSSMIFQSVGSRNTNSSNELLFQVNNYTKSNFALLGVALSSFLAPFGKVALGSQTYNRIVLPCDPKSNETVIATIKVLVPCKNKICNYTDEAVNKFNTTVNEYFGNISQFVKDNTDACAPPIPKQVTESKGFIAGMVVLGTVVLVGVVVLAVWYCKKSHQKKEDRDNDKMKQSLVENKNFTPLGSYI